MDIDKSELKTEQLSNLYKSSDYLSVLINEVITILNSLIIP